MTNLAAEAAVVFGATGRLGRVMLQGLDRLGVESIPVTRHMLSNYRASGDLPVLPERLVLVDASIDYANLRRHEADKQAMVEAIARRSRIELAASFSSGATDFDDALITNPFYLEYKRVKLDALAFLRSLATRVFYPKIYTLIGPASYVVKSTGWVQVLDQSCAADEVSIAHPHEPRSWVAEGCIQQLFASFVAGTRADYLEAPVCGTFRLADIVALCEARRGRSVAISRGQATPWLQVPYVAPHPDHVGPAGCSLPATLASLLDGRMAH